MFARPRNTLRYALLAALAVFAHLSTAQAALSPDIAGRIRQLANNWHASELQQRRMAHLSGDTQIGGVASDLNRQVSASSIAQEVMDAIARNPADTGEAVALAVHEAPELAAPIKASLVRAYPGLAQTIETAGRAEPPRSSAAPPKAAPATAPTRTAPPRRDPRDPLEGINRAVFGFNDFLDTYLIAPVARAYRWVMPETLRAMGRDFLRNFNEPVVAINDVLQGDISNAGNAAGRFAINSTIGILGFFDIAKQLHLPAHPADFGQTLDRYGVGSGPYLVLPVIGRTTAREAVGEGVDLFLNPLTYLFNFDFDDRLYLKAGDGFLKRAARIDRTDKLKKTPPDYYTAARNAWFRQRARELSKQPSSPAGNSEGDK